MRWGCQHWLGNLASQPLRLHQRLCLEEFLSWLISTGAPVEVAKKEICRKQTKNHRSDYPDVFPLRRDPCRAAPHASDASTTIALRFATADEPYSGGKPSPHGLHMPFRAKLAARSIPTMLVEPVFTRRLPRPRRGSHRRRVSSSKPRSGRARSARERHPRPTRYCAARCRPRFPAVRPA